MIWCDMTRPNVTEANQLDVVTVLLCMEPKHSTVSSNDRILYGRAIRFVHAVLQ